MSPRPFKLTQPAPSEHLIQNAILRYLELDRRVAWARRFNTGAQVVEQVNAQGRKVRRFIRYAFPGCADILGQLSGCGRFLAIEVKAAKGDATEAQREFLRAVTDAGGVAVIARSIEDVKAALDAGVT